MDMEWSLISASGTLSEVSSSSRVADRRMRSTSVAFGSVLIVMLARTVALAGMIVRAMSVGETCTNEVEAFAARPRTKARWAAASKASIDWCTLKTACSTGR